MVVGGGGIELMRKWAILALMRERIHTKPSRIGGVLIEIRTQIYFQRTRTNTRSLMIACFDGRPDRLTYLLVRRSPNRPHSIISFTETSAYLHFPSDKTMHDKTKTRQDKTRQDKTCTDKTKTRQDKTRQDKTRQDMHRQDIPSSFYSL